MSKPPSMKSPQLTTEQEVALIQEVENSVLLVHEGFLALNSLSGANDFYHGPMQLLAQGFERLMKVVVCLWQLESRGALPQLSEIRKLGHDLVALADEITRLAKQSQYRDSRPALQDDIDFIAGNRRLRELLSALKDFGKWGRYSDLDTLLDPNGPGAQRDDPVVALQAIETRILTDRPELIRKMKGPGFNDVYGFIKGEVIATLQRFARALCRTFTLGPLGNRGQRLVGQVGTFLYLDDAELSTVPPRWFEKRS